jgi:hypothetical protein
LTDLDRIQPCAGSRFANPKGWKGFRSRDHTYLLAGAEEYIINALMQSAAVPRRAKCTVVVGIGIPCAARIHVAIRIRGWPCSPTKVESNHRGDAEIVRGECLAPCLDSELCFATWFDVLEVVGSCVLGAKLANKV